MVYSPVRDIAAKALERIGLALRRDVEVLEARYWVQRLEPLLYLGGGSKCSMAAIDVLGAIVGTEAEAALAGFVENEAGKPEMKSLVDEAQATLNKLNAVNHGSQ